MWFEPRRCWLNWASPRRFERESSAIATWRRQRHTHLRSVHEVPAHERLVDAVRIADPQRLAGESAPHASDDFRLGEALPDRLIGQGR